MDLSFWLGPVLDILEDLSFTCFHWARNLTPSPFLSQRPHPYPPNPTPETLGTWRPPLSAPHPSPVLWILPPSTAQTALVPPSHSSPSRTIVSSRQKLPDWLFSLCPFSSSLGRGHADPLWVSLFLCETLRDFSLHLGDTMTFIMCQGPCLLLPLPSPSPKFIQGLLPALVHTKLSRPAAQAAGPQLPSSSLDALLLEQLHSSRGASQPQSRQMSYWLLEAIPTVVINYFCYRERNTNMSP